MRSQLLGRSPVSSSSVGGVRSSSTGGSGGSLLGGGVGVGGSSMISPSNSIGGVGVGSSIDVEQRLGIVKRNRGGSGRGSVAPSPLPAVEPPCDHYPAFDTTTPLSGTSVAIVRKLAVEMIDCLWFPEAATH